MTDFGKFGDVSVDIDDQFVATVELHRPPHNYFDLALIQNIAAAFEALDADPRCRAIVLCSEGKSFCAGAQLGGGPRAQSQATAPAPSPDPDAPPRHLE